MKSPYQFALLSILIASAGVASCSFPSTANAQQEQQSSLRVRRWSFRTDRAGKSWLALDIANYGDRGVNVAGVSATGWLYSSIGQDIAAGGVLNVTVPVDQEPAFVWIATSEGRFRFDLLRDH
jgi:hypothetical protein